MNSKADIKMKELSNKYRKIPVEVEAVQWNGQNVVDMYNFLEGTNYESEAEGVKSVRKKF